jgi:hypothetical protein
MNIHFHFGRFGIFSVLVCCTIWQPWSSVAESGDGSNKVDKILLKKMKNLAIPLQNNCKNIVKYIVFVC